MIFEVITLVVLIIAFVVSGYLSFYLIRKSRVRKAEKPLVAKRNEPSIDNHIMRYQSIYDEYVYLTALKKSKRTSMQEVYLSNKFDNIIETLSQDSFKNLSADTNLLHVELFPKAAQQSSGFESEIELNKPSYTAARKYIELPVNQYVH
ncbi:MAG: hypothetical protein ACN6NW_06945 [Acinetobacter amyesii]|uniref:hypothetical protein n=1 Tax=Acinetobacter amyesii TaxID=2942470 RepID=UPI003D08CD71